VFLSFEASFCWSSSSEETTCNRDTHAQQLQHAYEFISFSKQHGAVMLFHAKMLLAGWMAGERHGSVADVLHFVCLFAFELGNQGDQINYVGVLIAAKLYSLSKVLKTKLKLF
jgi:hypothetical protein